MTDFATDVDEIRRSERRALAQQTLAAREQQRHEHLDALFAELTAHRNPKSLPTITRGGISYMRYNRREQQIEYDDWTTRTLDDEQQAAMLAHELAHHDFERSFHHFVRVFAFCALAAVSVLISPWIAATLFVAWAWLNWTLFAQLEEFAADRRACTLLGSTQAYLSMLRMMSADRWTPWGQHPPLSWRIALVERSARHPG